MTAFADQSIDAVLDVLKIADTMEKKGKFSSSGFFQKIIYKFTRLLCTSRIRPKVNFKQILEDLNSEFFFS